ncbi:MAG: hypothetical protein IPH75_11055 [bacterium]|nr:hypothetical protein [bacterium]
MNLSADRPSEFVPEATQPEGPSVSWTIHPVKRKPWLSAIVTSVVLLFSFLVFVATESTFFCFLSLVVLFASLAKFYMPTSYTLTEKEVIVKTTTQTLRKEWSLYRSYWPDKNGILLSPFVGQSRLENFRGLYLIFGENREEATAFVKKRIPQSTGEQS